MSQVLAVSALSSVENKKMKQTCHDELMWVQNQSTEGDDCKKVLISFFLLLIYDMAFFKNCPEEEETTKKKNQSTTW